MRCAADGTTGPGRRSQRGALIFRAAQDVLRGAGRCAMLPLFARELLSTLRGRKQTFMHRSPGYYLLTIAIVISLAASAREVSAQQRGESAPRYSVQSFRERRTTGANTERANEAKRGETKLSELSERELYLLERLEQRLTDLEARVGDAVTDHSVHSAELPVPVTTAGAASPDHAQPPQGTKTTADFFRETTFSFTLDGYYGYNFNRPAGRINLLRAYDVTSNSFSLNQAGLIIERAPNPTAGRRFGARVDLQYGQATETLQGSGANEPRPQTYRPIFQAYGTYVVPIGGGLTVDFGKWASALGFENNYTKDQMNYSRSYSYNFLPFYHFGVSRELHRGPGWGELLGDEWGKPERGLQRL